MQTPDPDELHQSEEHMMRRCWEVCLKARNKPFFNDVYNSDELQRARRLARFIGWRLRKSRRHGYLLLDQRSTVMERNLTLREAMRFLLAQ